MARQAMILRGARVIDPASETDAVMDIGVADGVFVPPETIAGCPVHDLSGLVLAPGFVDMHVHLRDPGQTHKEDIASATAAAAAGGFTTVVAMPNTKPPVDSPEVVRDILDRAASKAKVRVLQTGALSIGLKGERLTDAAALKAAGVVALTDDGACIQRAGVMRQALQAARAVELPVLDHCEDAELAGHGAIHDGEVARRLHVPGKPGSAEEVMVARNAVLAREAGWGIHMQHVSTAAGCDLLRMMRRAGWPVTGEASPHHLCLTEEAVIEHGTNAKMNPPLRSEADRQAVIEALCDGTLSVIATDHAPHTLKEKAVGLCEAPNGIVGLEAAVPLCLTELYHSGRMELPDLIGKFTVGPCVVLALPYGTLTLGRAADVTLLDLERRHVIDTARFHSKSANCPWQGWRCRGAVAGVMVAGQWVVRP